MEPNAQELKDFARTKLENALELVAKRAAARPGFYGLLSDDVPKCYVEDTEEPDVLTVVLFEANAVHVKVNNDLLGTDEQTLAACLYNMYSLSDPMNRKQPHPSGLDLRRDPEQSGKLKQKMVLKNICDYLVQHGNINDQELVDRMNQHTRLVQLMSEAELRCLLIDQIETYKKLLEKAISANGNAVPEGQAWWRDYAVYDLDTGVLVFGHHRKSEKEVDDATVFGTTSIDRLRREALNFACYAKEPFYGAEECVAQRNQGSELPINWKRVVVDGKPRYYGTDGVLHYYVDYCPNELMFAYRLETSNTDTKRRYANINEALTAAYAVQRNHMSVIQNGYAALQKALRK